MRHLTAATTIGMLSGVLMSCTPLATYPPDNRPLGQSVVNEPVPTLIADAVSYSASAYGDTDDLAINLPPGSTMRLYERVIAHLGEGRPQTNAAEAAYHVTKVRCRGLAGEVDMFIPQRDGSYRFATLYFQSEPFQPFRHIRTRWWDLNESPPAPAYAAAPDREVVQPVLAHD